MFLFTFCLIPSPSLPDSVQRDQALVDSAEKPSGQTALHFAVCMQHESLVRMLISRGANVSAGDAQGRTPLHLLFADRSQAPLERIYKLLVEKGAHVNAIDELGQTTVHVAAQRGDVAILRYLESVGGDVRAQDAKGKTPLHMAANTGIAQYVNPPVICASCAILRLLVAAENRRQSCSCLCSCCVSDVCLPRRTLIEMGCDIEAADIGGRRPLHDAASSGNLEVRQSCANVGRVAFVCLGTVRVRW